MSTHDLEPTSSQSDGITQELSPRWRQTRTRADMLKLGATTGLGLGLLGSGTTGNAAAGDLSGTLALTWNYAPGPV